MKERNGPMGNRIDVFENIGWSTTEIQEELEQEGTMWWEVGVRSREL